MNNYKNHYYNHITVAMVKKASNQCYEASLYWKTKDKEKASEYLEASKELDDLIK